MVFNAAFPILPGKLELAKAFGRDAMARAARSSMSTRSAVASSAKRGLFRSRATAVVCHLVESTDPEKAITVSTEDLSEFATWFRFRVKEISGIDLTEAPARPSSTVTLDWSSQS